MPVLKERIEIRVIGTDQELERAAEIIGAAYDIHYQSDYYSCKGYPDRHRQYYKVTEKEGVSDGQDHKANR